MSKGTLYGVGVGPGDPELMTVKAWRIVSMAKVIAYLSANGGESTARKIAAPFVAEDVEEMAIDVPMKVERAPAMAAYDESAERIATKLDQGQDVVMLCEGDPFFYGSFIYVFERLASKFTTVIVPGVTSITAAAAEMGRPLCMRDDVLKVLPATLPADRLREELMTAQSAAIIKVGRHFGKVKTILSALDLYSQAIAIENATHEGQRIRKVGEIVEDALPYFTTIIVRA
ncbi:MAG: precorrin-2 C(20)-methyltransferase [Rhizobiales bacterium]|nr:precorrin-2 C(20)-methyltransferase [Hyphomicrobiales bacterium]